MEYGNWTGSVDRGEVLSLEPNTRDKLLLFLTNPIKRGVRNITRNINFLLPVIRSLSSRCLSRPLGRTRTRLTHS